MDYDSHPDVSMTSNKIAHESISNTLSLYEPKNLSTHVCDGIQNVGPKKVLPRIAETMKVLMCVVEYLIMRIKKRALSLDL